MTRFLRQLAAVAAAAAALVGGFLAPAQLHAQPVSTWNYDVDPATGSGRATYPGEVNILGACTGCSGASLLGLNNTWTGTNTFQGSTGLAAIFTNAAEPVTVTGSAIGSAANIGVLAQSIDYYNVAATSNWTMNLRGSASASLNSVLGVGQAATIVALVQQGATAYYQTALTIDGTSAGVTVYWQGGSAPSVGNPNGIDVYTFTVIKTAASTYTVLASQSQF